MKSQFQYTIYNTTKSDDVLKFFNIAQHGEFCLSIILTISIMMIISGFRLITQSTFMFLTPMTTPHLWTDHRTQSPYQRYLHSFKKICSGNKYSFFMKVSLFKYSVSSRFLIASSICIIQYTEM